MSARRIVYLVTGLQAGGAETMLLHVLRGLDRTLFEPSVISLMDRGTLGSAIDSLGVPVHAVGLMQGRPTSMALVRLIGLVRAARPDLIQGWMYHGNFAAQLAGLIVRAPVCWCIQNSFHSFAAEKRVTRWVIRLLARMSRLPARIIYVAHASRAQHEKLGFASPRGVVIPNGVDPGVFRPSAEDRISVRAELGLPGDAILIGLIGRCHPQKDHANFLRAATLLAAELPSVRFVLAGAGVTGDNPVLGAQAQAQGLADRVHLLGERHDMPRLNAGLDLATSSSSYGEGLSLAVAEAMGCGVPCVVTDVGDSARLIGQTGVVVPPGDARALAAGWKCLLAADRQALGAAARQRAAEHYSVQSIVRRYEEIYDALT